MLSDSACKFILRNKYSWKTQLSFYFIDPSQDILDMISDDQLGFEPPNNFVDHPRYRVTDSEREFMSDLPSLYFDIIHHVLPQNPTLDPLTPFYFMKTGQLPMYVVKWFVQAQKPSRLSNMTLFYRAMHCIEHVRGYSHGVIEEVQLVEGEQEGEEEEEEYEAPRSQLKVKLTKGKHIKK